MRLVICRGIQYDADNLPPHVDASTCLPADQWFAENQVVAHTPARVEPTPAEAPKTRRPRATRARKN